MAEEPAPGYESTALAGKLTEAQLDAIVEKFVHTSDVGLIARALDIPRALVLEALENGTLAERALKAKRNAATVRFLGLAIDRMLAVLAMPASKGSTHEALQAARLLRDLLGLKSESPAEPAEPKRGPGRPRKEPVDPPAPKTRLGPLERALAELGDD